MTSDPASTRSVWSAERQLRFGLPGGRGKEDGKRRCRGALQTLRVVRAVGQRVRYRRAKPRITGVAPGTSRGLGVRSRCTAAEEAAATASRCFIPPVHREKTLNNLHSTRQVFPAYNHRANINEIESAVERRRINVPRNGPSRIDLLITPQESPRSVRPSTVIFRLEKLSIVVRDPAAESSVCDWSHEIPRCAVR